MEHILQIKIKKNKVKAVFYLENEIISFDSILSYINENNVTLVHIETIENENTLLEGYISCFDMVSFEIFMKKASKAKIIY